MQRLCTSGIRHFGVVVSRTCKTAYSGFERNAVYTFPCVGRLQNRFDAIRCFSADARPETVMNVFDRKAKRTQKNISALSNDYEVYEYLREEVSGH